MKATGIVRRIDDLGRIGVPKEVRMSVGIKEGDPLEFFTTRDGEIVLKPFQTGDEKFNNFLEAFKEMDIADKKNIIKTLVEEMN